MAPQPVTLHCLYGAPDSAAAHRCRETLSTGDAVLLLSAATILADPGHPELASWLSEDIEIFALEEDLHAHGVAVSDDSVVRIDYSGWVALVMRQPRQQLWS